MILTYDEFKQQYAELLQSFANAWTAKMVWERWRIGTADITAAKQLWLYVFAMSTWQHEDAPREEVVLFNYFKEELAIEMLSHARALGSVPCGCDSDTVKIIFDDDEQWLVPFNYIPPPEDSGGR